MHEVLSPLWLVGLLLPVGFVVHYLVRSSQLGGTLRRTAQASGGASARSFFARTGYWYVDATDRSCEAQERRASSEGPSILAGRYFVQYARERGGLRCEFRQATFFRSQLASFPGGAAAAQGHGSYHLRGSRGAPSTYMLCSWRVSAPQPPRLLLHIAERSLGSGSLTAAMAGDRPWRARAPHRIATHLPAFDQRFQLHTNDPEQAVALLRAHPQWMARLFECVEVDLWTDALGAEFSDPELHNLVGGRSTQLRVAADPEEYLARTVRQHDRVTDLLADLLRAAC